MQVAARTAAWAKSGGAPLPYDAEVEYLESTGTQIINTEYAPTLSMVVTADVVPLVVTGESIWGSKAPFDFTDYRVFNANSNIYYDFMASRLVGSSFPVNERTVIETGNYYVKKDGVEVLRGTAVGSSSITDEIVLFGGYGDNKTIARFYSFKISDGGALVRDFIPVRVGSVGYMYDRVSKRLFGNAGTGAFVIGPDKT